MNKQKSPRPPLSLGAILLAFGLALAVQAQTPIITSQPTAQTTILGGRAVFTVMAESQAPLTHQWRRDGTAIPGATNDVLILTNVQFHTAGQYSVVVSNALGGVESTNAALTVNWPRAGDVDFSFDPGSSINGTIYSVAVQPDGKVLIAGSFTSVNDAARGRVARLNADGTTDHTFMNGMTGADGVIWSLALQPDGKVLIGGFFGTVNGVSRQGVARLNADGSIDPDFAAANKPGVNAVLLLPGGQILIGGSFDRYGEWEQGGIDRLNVDGSMDLTFRSGQPGVQGGWPNYPSVVCVAAQPDGKVLIGGRFAEVNNVGRTNIARLNPDGSLDTNFLSSVSGDVHCIVVQADERVLIGGSFTNVNGVSATKLARLNADGSLDTSFLSGLSQNWAAVYCIAVQTNGQLLIGHEFGMARLDADGRLDATFACTLNGFVAAIAPALYEGWLIAGGFTSVDATNRNRIARLQSDGALDPVFSNPTGGVGLAASNRFGLKFHTFTGPIVVIPSCGAIDVTPGGFPILMQPDGKVLIGGGFSSVNGQSHTGIARLNPDGTMDGAFLSGISELNGGLVSISRQMNDKILIGGRFTTGNGESRTNLARLNADGSLDTNFMSGMAGLYHECCGVAYSTAQQPDGKIVVGGRFSAVNGESRTNIARLNEDGSLDTTFQNGMSGADSPIVAITVQADAKILIGGSFTNVNGVCRTNLARLNADGSLDTNFLSGIAQQWGAVICMATLTNGQLLVGGQFGVARLNPDGSPDPAFTYTETGVGWVFSVALQEDGKLVAGGEYGIARLNTDGSLDTEFLWGLAGINGSCRGAIQPDGGILVAGQFGTANGVGRSGIVRLYSSSQGPAWIAGHPLDQALFAGGDVTLSVMAFGASPLVYQWYWNGIQIYGATNCDYTIPTVETNQQGSYSVVVTNSLGNAASSNALLTVWPVVSLGEALDAPHLVWTTGGDEPWFGQTLETFDGMDAACSGPVGISYLGWRSTWLETTVVGPGELSFRCKVSTCGYLFFYVDGATQGSWITNVDWERLTFSLPPGTHTLRWSYWNASCLGSAWLDEVSFVPAGLPPVSLSHGDLLPNGNFQLQLTGEPGREYIIQASTNLVHWVTVTNLASPTGMASFIDADAKLYPRRFYRAMADVYSGLDQPMLQGIRVGGDMVLSWPASFAGFGLESTPTMVNPIWSPVVPAPVIVENAYTVTNSITGGSKFYRLRRQ